MNNGGSLDQFAGVTPRGRLDCLGSQEFPPIDLSPIKVGQQSSHNLEIVNRSGKIHEFTVSYQSAKAKCNNPILAW